MKKLSMLFVLITFINVIKVHASPIECQANLVMAEYQLSQLDVNQKLTASPLTLIRNGKRVAHYDKQEKTADIWYLNNANQLQLTRMFEAFEQGIEYQPSEISASTDWLGKSSLIATRLFDKMSLVKTSHSGCEQTQFYQLENEHYLISLAWLPHLKLIDNYQVVHKDDNQTIKQLQLVTKQHRKAAIDNLFKRWDGLKTTDYSDVGDNENNPFLAKMINQGFGEGVALKHDHHH